jgi:hypothetical protein
MRTRSASRLTVRAEGGSRSRRRGGWLARIRQLLAWKDAGPARSGRHERGRPAFEALEDRSLPSVSSWVYPGIDGHLIYTPDGQADRILDYSNVGYRSGAAPIPTVPARVTVSPGPGDDTALVQAAIDQVSALPLDAGGFRGAVLLTAGEYQIGGHLEIRASGVVLRGEGDSETGTILRATGTDRRALVQVAGSGARAVVPGTEHGILGPYVPAGARSFPVQSTEGLRVGDTVAVTRYGTAGWIRDIGMDQGLSTPWAPGQRDLVFDRVITRIEGNWITVDAPLANAIEEQYGGATVARYAWPGRIENVGVEDLRGMSDFTSATDEDHSWSFISLDAVQDAWVRNVTALHFAFAAVDVLDGAKWVTVQECRSLAPVSQITGDRRYPFHLDGQLSLVRDCYSEEGRHDYAMSSLTAGPNVFVDSRAVNAYSNSGPHLNWSVGALFDNLDIVPAAAGGDAQHRGTLDIENRGNLGPNHGWAGANMTVWNTAAAGFRVQDPPGAQNWLIGSAGPLLPPGSYAVGPAPPGRIDSHDIPVEPRSLYYAQLQERLAHPGLDYREYWLGDIDALGAGNTADNVPTDPAWQSQIQSQTALPLHGFDDARGDHWLPFTFNFALDPGERVVGATLSLGLRATAGDGSADRIYLDGLDTSLTLAELGWAPLPTTETAGRVLDLGDRLALLQDGRLNVALATNLAVDWAVLHLQVAPLSAAGEAPTISDVPDQTIDEDGSTEVITFTVGDAETPPASLTVTAVSSNPALVPDANIVLGGEGADRTVTVTPAPNQSGSAMIALTVRDADGRTATEAFEVRVLAVNDAPSAATGSATTTPDTPVLVDLRSLVGDMETPADQLRFRVGGAVNGTVTLLADGHTARFTPDAGYTGPAAFAYTATDIGHGPDVLLHYSFEPPDTDPDGTAADGGAWGRDGLLQRFDGGRFAFVPDVPAALAPWSSRSLQLVEEGDTTAALLTRHFSPAELDFNNHDWTFAGWFQRGDLDNDDTIFHLGSGDLFGGDNELYIAAGAGQASVSLQHWAGPNLRDVLISRSGISAGQWHHVAVVFRAAGAGGQGVLQFYVDGVLAGSDSDFTLNMDPSFAAAFGGHDHSLRLAARFFNGKLDDLILYRAALGAGDIAQLAGGPAGHREGLTTAPTAVDVTVSLPPPRVTALTPTGSGFVAGFSRPIDAALLNLYDTRTGGLGPADVLVAGAATGPVSGSLVVDPSGTRVTFVRTGGELPPDTYTVTLRSAADGFRAPAGGELLDGDGDGTPGDDFVSSFTPPAGVVVSVRDLVRGPGQPAEVPLRLSVSAGITSVSLALRYDPALLTITGAALAPGLPTGATATLDTGTPGVALVTFHSPWLPAGIEEFIRLKAAVPRDAGYALTHVLDLTDITINGAVPALDDDGLHVVAYFGDASGDGGYGAADAVRVLRVAVGLDSGFAAYPLADPVLIADVTGDGVLGLADAIRILLEALGIDQPQIPPLPPGPPVVGVLP